MYLTLDEAAAKLGKTGRQLRYMIQKGELRASKVGGRWRIESDDLPRRGRQKEAQERKGRNLRRAVEDALDLPRDSPRRYSVTDLKAFQIALPLYERTHSDLGDDHPATLKLRCVLHLLTQGCHRYEHEQKAAAYREARDAASAAVCELVISNNEAAHEIRQGIEQDLMAAFAGLLRFSCLARGLFRQRSQVAAFREPEQERAREPEREHRLSLCASSPPPTCGSSGIPMQDLPGLSCPVSPACPFW